MVPLLTSLPLWITLFQLLVFLHVAFDIRNEYILVLISLFT